MNRGISLIFWRLTASSPVLGWASGQEVDCGDLVYGSGGKAWIANGEGVLA